MAPPSEGGKHSCACSQCCGNRTNDDVSALSGIGYLRIENDRGKQDDERHARYQHPVEHEEPIKYGKWPYKPEDRQHYPQKEIGQQKTKEDGQGSRHALNPGEARQECRDKCGHGAADEHDLLLK